MYDITNTPNSHANEAIKTLNRFTRDTFGLGGIFHGAVEVNGEEWSFGYCPYGTGVRSSAQRPARSPQGPRGWEAEPLGAPLPVCLACAKCAKCRRAQVYNCTPKGNPNYTFRESIPLGVTSISQQQARRAALRKGPAAQIGAEPLLSTAVPTVYRGAPGRVAGLDIRPAEPQLQPLL